MKDDEIEAADTEIKGLMSQAYPYLKTLHKLQPNEREWLSQLVNVTGFMGKDDEMMEYSKKLAEMNK